MNCTKTEKFPQLCYRKSGSGPALLLIHGFPENGELWYKVVPELAAQFTVIVPDLPGSGESTFTGNLSLEDMADGLNDILKEEGVDKVVLAGHSMGGYTALAFAERYADKVAGISLVHALASADDDEKKETRRKSIELIKKGGKDIFVKQMIPNLFSKAFKGKHPDVIEKQKERGLNLSAESMVAFYTAMMNRPDRSGILKYIERPVQFITGKEDGIAAPEKAAEQIGPVDKGFISVYTDCGHMSMLEQPELLIKDLQEFIHYSFSH